MTRTRWTTRALLLGSLAMTSACMRQGDFCDVVTGPITFTRETSAQIVRTDRDKAERIDVQNQYGAGHCPSWN